jgi:aminoglycoside N3'-acetyltransferase
MEESRKITLDGRERLESLLEKLDIHSGDIVFLHISYKWMSYLGLDGQQIIDTIVHQLTPAGTLVMPSYAWHLDKSQRPWKGYADYVRQQPVFDVCNTPTNMGWIPELFRSMPGVIRSLNYCWPICVKGPFAHELTAAQEKVFHPFAEDSSFGMLHKLGVKILGLGVSLNTTSLAHLADYALRGCHPQQVFSNELQSGVIIDYRGTPIETRSYRLLPEVARLVKPEKVIENSPELRRVIRRADEGDTIQFSYPYQVYHQEAVRLGEQACADKKKVPWLEDYPLKEEPTS